MWIINVNKFFFNNYLSKHLDFILYMDKEYDTLWCDKYKPKCLDDICGNKDNIHKIKSWIDDFRSKKEGTKMGLFISGPPGIGKTSLSHLILTNYNYEIIEYNASDVRSQKSVKESLNKVLNSTNISVMKGSSLKVIAVIMDEVDGMSSGDRGGVSELVSIINPNKGKRKVNKTDFIYSNPIICISNNNTDKKLSDLRKNCHEITFSKPTQSDVLLFSKKIIKSEHIDIDDMALTLLVNYSQCDFRRITYLLQDIHNTYHNKRITIDDIEELFNNFSKKKIDLGLFDATKKLLTNYKSLNETLSLYESDRSLVSMMIHENFLLNINEKDFQTNLPYIYNVYHYMALGDIIDRIIYNNQTWYLQDFNGVIKCSYPSYMCNNIFSKNKQTTKTEFTSILSKSAIQFSNFKCIISIKNKFKVNKRYLYYLTYPLLKNLFLRTEKDKSYQKTIKLMKYYNLNVTLIEKMVKLSKANEENDFKKMFTNKMKTKFKKILE